MIEQARIQKINKKGTKYNIFVRLKKDYHSEFERRTGDNTGNHLAVVHEGKILSPILPVIQVKISGGSFPIGPYKKEEQAKRVLQKIMDKDK